MLCVLPIIRKYFINIVDTAPQHDESINKDEYFSIVIFSLNIYFLYY